MSDTQSMNAGPEHPGAVTGAHRRQPAIWDAADSLRGEILTEDQLAEHAAWLASTHDALTTSGSARPLRKRFEETRRLVQQAYTTLAEGAERKRDPSPAEIWLLDNSHVVEGQLREIEEDLPWGYLVKLPRMRSGPMRGYPLVYGLCLDYLRHTDCRIDFTSLSRFVDAYQTVRPLTIGELWAVPIMLRLGLVLAVGALASSEANGNDRDLAEKWAVRVLGSGSRNSTFDVTQSKGHLRELQDLEAPSDAFLVTFLKRLRERDDAPSDALDWIAEQTARLGATPEELARRYHLRQAAGQVSVGNAITSMRSINRLDWSVFFAATSIVEHILACDPSGAYAGMDDTSRDRCRHAVERLARRSPLDERQIAERVLELAERDASLASSYRAHVGYYLVDDGLQELERTIAYRNRIGEAFMSLLQRQAALFYLGFCATLTTALGWFGWRALERIAHAPFLHAAIVPVLLLAASEIAVAIVNSWTVSLVPPRLLPKLEFKGGIPEEHRTLVVVPTLFDSEGALRRLFEDLEVRSLANSDEYLHFALLTDFPDASTAERPGEEQLLDLAAEMVEKLNEGTSEPRFFFFHRRRVENSIEHVFMGWERKRGKLDELNRLLRGATDTTFSRVLAPAELLKKIRYVITLDTDTELPMGVARRLVGALAHPLNRPIVDSRQQRVVRGHAIIQPRVGTSPMSARQSIYSRLAAGPPGIDPYTTAVSDVYQDLFGEGSFVGKGIYDVDAFAAAMRGRVPENQLLSHDLLESIYARAALASDIEVLDEQPAAYSVAAGRQHRWTRGDWQLLPWLLPRVPGEKSSRTFDFRAFDAWRVLDNLRRSLVAPALLVLALCTWFSGLPTAIVGTLFLLGVFIVPVLGRVVFGFVRARSQLEWLGGLGGDLKTNSQQALLSIVFLLDQAFVSVDALARALYRQLVSRHKMLEWTSMRDAARAGEQSVLRVPRLLVGSAVALVLTGLLVRYRLDSVPVAGPFLFAWLVSPWVAKAVSRIRPLSRSEPWGEEERTRFRYIARKTWRFFDVFVGDLDNHLPPDNFQEDPRGVVAHRTSPTNIGLYLLSVASARDLGFISITEVLARTRKTLGTIERLEKREGHVLNWYDTTNLQPLEPRYVSTVDSGNLAGYLWTLAETCSDFELAPLVGASSLAGALDAARVASEQATRESPTTPAPGFDETKRIEGLIEAAEREVGFRPAEFESILSELHRQVAALVGGSNASARSGELQYWLEAARDTLANAIRDGDRFLPHLLGLEVGAEVLLDETRRGRFDAIVEETRELRSIRVLRDAAEPLRVRVEELRREIEHELDAAASGSAASLRVLSALYGHLETARVEAEHLGAELEDVARRARQLADQMNFRFLYDEERSLFSIGYNASGGRLDNSHYDLLASEARLASLVAIAKGDVPQKHWFRLGRLRAQYASVPGLLSWSGSMFEYLMPLLVMRSYPDTLLDQTYHAAIERQIAYARGFDVPWGISEAAYNVMDLGMNYQYRAFGVPELGLKPGLGEDLVVAPYATALAGLVRARAAAQNFVRLTESGLEGRYGYYEAVDYTPSRLPPSRDRVIVKAFMAHHQGMTLVALANLLTDFSMQRRFHADARIKACDLLLEERIPVKAGVVKPETPRIPSNLATTDEFEAVERIGFKQSHGSELRSNLLGHGSVSTLVTAGGEGFTNWRGVDVNRFREEGSLGAGGTYVYISNRSRSTQWSSGYLPTRSEPDQYDAIFSLDKVEFLRRDAEVETLTEIVVSPEQPVEVRRITLTNHGSFALALDVTTYMELSLAPRVSDVAHPAFQKMFVETESVPGRGALIARRRPRSQGEAEIWVGQILLPVTENVGELSFETSRAHFLGRGRSLVEPQGLESGVLLGEHTGAVLDPAFVLRRSIELGPGAQAKLSLITVLAESRAGIIELLELFAAPHSVPRAFELAWADARVELKHLGVSGAQSHRYQRLLSAVLFPSSALRGAINPPSGNRGRDALWSQGISGDLPIIVLRLDDSDFTDLCRDLLLAHEFWRLNGMSSDLVILNEEAESYLQPVQDAVLSLIRSTPAEGHVDQRGGVFIRRSTHIADEDLQLLLAASRIVMRASAGSLAKQLRALAPKRDWTVPSRELPHRVNNAISRGPRLVHDRVARRPSTPAPAPRPALGPLEFANGIGGFSADGRQYVLEVNSEQRPPQPWCNVIAGPEFGTLVTESGASFTWYQNSQKNRLTPWSNDPTLDPSGELFYLRDRDSDEVWSLTPAPAGGSETYVVRHAQGWSSFTHRRGDLDQTLTLSVSPTDAVKVWHARITNTGSAPRRLSAYGYVEWVLGNNRESLRVSTVTSWRPEARALLARNPFSPLPTERAFFAATSPIASVSADRSEFFGRWGSRQRPQALAAPLLSGRIGAGLDPCGTLQLDVDLQPGETREFAFVLGVALGEADALELAGRYAQLETAAQVAGESEAAWDRMLTQVTVKTPDPAFDMLTNRWLLYQVIGCRYWGRSGFFQSGGAYGYRDQLQDSLAFLHARPDLTREHLLLAASRQFTEGDVQHWWHADTGEGVRTHCSDDLLWLPWVAAEYAESTGDRGIWDEQVSFLHERLLKTGEDDLYSVPAISGEHASLYEHCVRALEAGNTRGPNGLPTMRAGDWNDGMNRVGLDGRGESVWLAWFLAGVLDRFAKVATARGDHGRASWCRSEFQRLGERIDAVAWDGAWYRRAFFDDGSMLGSSESPECRIDAIAQSWAVISRAGQTDRASVALSSSIEHLVDKQEKMMLLLTPPFTGQGPDPGYIAAYPAGVRENGGQYTHGVLWSALALLLEGRGTEGHELLGLLNPIHHTSDPTMLAKYQVEPYVMAADVYSQPPHVGRGGWTWYTGSASWMYRIGVESVLGIQRRGDRLEISPCIPESWPGFEASYRTPGGGRLRIVVDNSGAVQSGVSQMELDGVRIDGTTLELPKDSRDHLLDVKLGVSSRSGVHEPPPARSLGTSRSKPA